MSGQEARQASAETACQLVGGALPGETRGLIANNEHGKQKEPSAIVEVYFIISTHRLLRNHHKTGLDND